MPTHKWTVVLTLCYCAAGVVLLALDISLLGFSQALTQAANNPAKMLFHILLLPLAVFVLASSFPRAAWRLTLHTPWQKWSMLGLALLLAIVASIVIVPDARNGFENRITEAQSFADPRVRSDLVLVDQWLREHLPRSPNLADLNPPIDTRDAAELWRTPLVTPAPTESDEAAQSPAGSSALPEALPKAPKLTPDEAIARYKRFTRLLLDRPAGQAWVDWNAHGRSPSFARDAGIRSCTAAALSWLGIMAALAFFWSFCIWALQRGKPECSADETQRFSAGIALTLSLLASWMLLKVYTEWYSKYYSGAWSDSGELYVALFASAVALAVIFLFKIDIRRSGVALASVVAGASMVVGVAGKASPAAVDFVSTKYLTLEWHWKLLIYLAIFIGLFVLAVGWVRPLDPDAPSSNPTPPGAQDD